MATIKMIQSLCGHKSTNRRLLNNLVAIPGTVESRTLRERKNNAKTSRQYTADYTPMGSGSDSIGTGATCSPLLQMTGHGGTVSRRTANKKLTKLYWPSRKHSPKRLIVLVEPKNGAIRQKIPALPSLSKLVSEPLLIGYHLTQF